MSGVTDCYQPVERKLKLTRRCLEVLAEFRNPVFIVTKNHLVTRDIDLLSRTGAASTRCPFGSPSPRWIRNCARSWNRARRRRLRGWRRCENLSAAGIPVGVNVAPMIPGLTDHEMPAILKAAHEAGATAAGYTVVRLPYAVAPLFEKWLETHFPDRKEKVLNRLRAMHDGKLYKSEWGKRFTGGGIFAEQIAQMFQVARRKAGFTDETFEPSTAAFRRAGGTQLSLFS